MFTGLYTYLFPARAKKTKCAPGERCPLCMRTVPKPRARKKKSANFDVISPELRARAEKTIPDASARAKNNAA